MQQILRTLRLEEKNENLIILNIDILELNIIKISLVSNLMVD